MRHMSCTVDFFLYRLNMRTYFSSVGGGYVLCNWKCHAAHTCFFGYVLCNWKCHAAHTCFFGISLLLR